MPVLQSAESQSSKHCDCHSRKYHYVHNATDPVEYGGEYESISPTKPTAIFLVSAAATVLCLSQTALTQNARPRYKLVDLGTFGGPHSATGGTERCCFKHAQGPRRDGYRNSGSVCTELL
jgi:hypothetical protein